MTVMPEAVEIVLNQKLVEHEAAHAAAALVQGLHVGEAHAPAWTLTELEAGDPGSQAGFANIERRSDPDGLRKLAIAALAPHVGEAYWPPKWPLTLAPLDGDEGDLIELCKALSLDQAGYAELVQETYALTATREFERLQVAIGYALEQHGHLDEHALRRLKAITEDRAMERMTLKAAVATTTDAGTFEAVISTEGVDREKDIVSADAMVTALRKWNRPIPLAWNHSANAEDIIGSIDPQTVRAVNGEVVAGGQVDLDSNVGGEAWRSFKSRTIGFSFGYLIITATKRADGGRHITALDVFEVTSTPTPMNNDTRVLSTKAAMPMADTSLTDMLNRVDAHARGEHRKSIEHDELHAKAMRVARECAPVEITSFPC